MNSRGPYASAVPPQVSASGAVLLGKLGIRPFEYKIEVPETPAMA